MANKKNTISVVVPIYNVENYLRRCIDSILVQSRQAKEIILVDDGSPDNSPAICDDYAAKYSNVIVIHKPNGGLSSARLAGFKAATGDLIAFIDSDDYIHKDYLAKLAEPFDREDKVELSICGYATDNGSEISLSPLPYQSEMIDNAQVAEEYILPILGPLNSKDKINIPGFVPIRMYRRSLMQESDFVSEREYFTEDVLMNILYAKRTKGNIAIAKEPLYYYCVNPGSLTLKYRKGAFDMLMACNRLCRRLLTDSNVDRQHLENRLASNLVNTTTYSVYNIGKIRNYGQFKAELNKVFSTPEVIELFKSGKWPKVATWHKIIYYSHKFGAYFLLYKLLKTRKVL